MPLDNETAIPDLYGWNRYTCAGSKSCGQFRGGAPCQCSGQCSKYGNCCDDYDSICPRFMCASRGCGGGYVSGAPCQCNEDCARYGSCCKDYWDVCDHSGGSRSCKAHGKCRGLKGNCCPDEHGLFLFCCGHSDSPRRRRSEPQGGNS